MKEKKIIKLKDSFLALNDLQLNQVKGGNIEDAKSNLGTGGVSNSNR